MCREKVFANVSAGADTKASTLGAAAYSRLEILVSLRTAASADAPWALMSLLWRLQARGGAARGLREMTTRSFPSLWEALALWD